ncbi:MULTISPECIES: thiopeptide-type bacteriocin biosynthesis protein [Tenacibaculum]|uniref:thiopeptide-type bacteriocin biosynthesis protein n=1 Tax=Tenacibaculum TaxID=104267 RepID=UPI000EB49028|nr:thiopeptide-type bacteriocin biosynthesis protein [Tenacibaculum discolor]RLJ97900.1 thiopeptide-type bacteriocin biosynthesis protein [Tenacibaculum discolor]
MKRSFIIGDEWVYFKIYTGARTADNILTEVIDPIKTKLLNKKIITKWFFIRYNDSNNHLRVRFHYSNPENISVIINSLFTPLKNYFDNDLIWNVQIDTYNRELERYGINTMELSEKLFFYESELILNFLNKNISANKEEVRWLFGIKIIDIILDNFLFTKEEKKSYIDSLANLFQGEFNFNKASRKQLNQKYREKRKTIENIMNSDEFYLIQSTELENSISKFQKESKKICDQILQLNNENKLDVEIGSLISSYLHMFLNRLFKSKNRLNEMVCYSFLAKYYLFLIARINND